MITKQQLQDFGLIGLKYEVKGAKPLLFGIEDKDAQTIYDALETMAMNLSLHLDFYDSFEKIALAANIWAMLGFENTELVESMRVITERKTS